MCFKKLSFCVLISCAINSFANEIAITSPYYSAEKEGISYLDPHGSMEIRENTSYQTEINGFKVSLRRLVRIVALESNGLMTDKDRLELITGFKDLHLNPFELDEQKEKLLSEYHAFLNSAQTFVNSLTFSQYIEAIRDQSAELGEYNFDNQTIPKTNPQTFCSPTPTYVYNRVEIGSYPIVALTQNCNAVNIPFPKEIAKQILYPDNSNNVIYTKVFHITYKNDHEFISCVEGYEASRGGYCLKTSIDNIDFLVFKQTRREADKNGFGGVYSEPEVIYKTKVNLD